MRQVLDSIDGRLPAEKAVLFTVPPCGNFCIRSVLLISDEESSSTVAELWVDRGAGSRRIIPQMTIGALKDAQELTFIPLRTGDKIEGQASTADKVNYWIGYAMQLEA